MSTDIMCSECKKCDGDRCTYFDNDSDRESTIACILFEPKNPNVFNRITQSPEVLAEKLVLLVANFYPKGEVKWLWRSTIAAGSWETREEAIAATAEKLKEVEK